MEILLQRQHEEWWLISCYSQPPLHLRLASTNSAPNLTFYTLYRLIILFELYSNNNMDAEINYIKNALGKL